MNEPLDPTGAADPAGDPVEPAADQADAAADPGEPVARPVETDGEAPPPEAPPPAPEPVPARGPRGPLVALVAVLGLALAFGSGFVTGRTTAPGTEALAAPTGSPAAGTASPGASGAAPGTGRLDGLTWDGPRLGSATAPVTVDYWADYQCPFCARFSAEIIPALRSRIEDGSVALVHRDFAFLGPESFDAAVAVRCAGEQGRYWPMHDAVYAGQVGENQGAFARARLLTIAASAGVDTAALEACLDERAPLVAVLDDTAAGVRTGVVSTPTIDVNGTRFVGVPDVAELLAAVDAAVAGASPGTLPTPAPSTDPWSAVSTDGRTAGPADAPVTVELWMDYQAPASAAVAQALGPGLRERITAGEVRAVIRDAATLGDESVTAAVFQRCVADVGGPAWFVHEILAVSGRGAGSGIFIPGNLLRLSAQLGLPVAAIDACLSDPAAADAVRAETAEGAAAGITGGPTVVVRAGAGKPAVFTAPLDADAILAAIDAAKE